MPFSTDTLYTTCYDCLPRKLCDTFDPFAGYEGAPENILKISYFLNVSYLFQKPYFAEEIIINSLKGQKVSLLLTLSDCVILLFVAVVTAVPRVISVGASSLF